MKPHSQTSPSELFALYWLVFWMPSLGNQRYPKLSKFKRIPVLPSILLLKSTGPAHLILSTTQLQPPHETKNLAQWLRFLTFVTICHPSHCYHHHLFKGLPQYLKNPQVTGHWEHWSRCLQPSLTPQVDLSLIPKNLHNERMNKPYCKLSFWPPQLCHGAPILTPISK